MVGETVLLTVECACGSTHDAFGEELPKGGYDIAQGDLRCPPCTASRRPTRVVSIQERESLV